MTNEQKGLLAFWIVLGSVITLVLSVFFGACYLALTGYAWVGLPLVGFILAALLLCDGDPLGLTGPFFDWVIDRIEERWPVD